MAIACALLTGCGEAPPFELAPVRGTVMIDGRPLTNGRVMFAPIATNGSLEAGKPGLGRIAADGSFSLQTYKDGDGAIVGEHWVTIFGAKTPSSSVADASAPAVATATNFSRLRVPQKQAVVAGQENQIDIKLTSQDVVRYGRP